MLDHGRGAEPMYITIPPNSDSRAVPNGGGGAKTECVVTPASVVQAKEAAEPGPLVALLSYRKNG